MDIQEIDKKITEKAIQKVDNPVPRESAVENFEKVANALTQVQGAIVEKAKCKINDEKIIEKHSRKLAQISDKALEVETEKEELVVAEKEADNKVKKQDIKNKLIELRTEAIRLKKEQKQVLKEQKADHKKRNKQILWETYNGKLEGIGYDYVPNKFVLKMLLACDGIKSFFDGLGKISTAILKCFKWLLIFGGLIAVLMIIPVTRNYILELLQFA